MTLPLPVRFTLEDADRAHDEWGANCGPGALAALMGLTLDEVRPHMGEFERKGYTNLMLMLDSCQRIYDAGLCLGWLKIGAKWPRYGLAQIQWEGPWTNPGVPMRARYRYTHWIGVNALNENNIGVFDINCMNNGTGWCSATDWASTIAPHLIAQHPRANGKWHLTHAIEVDPLHQVTDDPSRSRSPHMNQNSGAVDL